jgi:hypothetical protein
MSKPITEYLPRSINNLERAEPNPEEHPVTTTNNLSMTLSGVIGK